MKILSIFSGIVILITSISTISINPNIDEMDLIKSNVLASITKQKNYTQLLINSAKKNQKDITLFKELRIEYSSHEHIISYYFPEEEVLLNSPPVPRFNDDKPNELPIAPSGFQLLEELYNEDSTNYDEITNELKAVLSNYIVLENKITYIVLSSTELFDSYRQQLYRIASIYMSGNDAPIYKNLSLKRSAISLENIGVELKYIQGNSPTLINTLLEGAVFYLNNKFNVSTGDSINNFDYFELYKSYILPIYKNLNLLQKELKIPFTEKISALNPTAVEMNSAEAFNILWFAKDKSSIPTASKIVELGRLLFYDPILSIDLKRSCASCHQPALAFTDSLIKNKSLNIGELPRNTPTLINCGLQYGQFWDVRINFLETQVKHVVGNENEMRGNWGDILSILNNSKEYTKLFNDAYNYSRDTTITIKNIVRAISMFERSLNATNSTFDLALRGKGVINQSIKNGFNVFMNKGACGSCHFFPLFNGTTPPIYFETESEVLGVPINFTNKKSILDGDIGREIKMKNSFFKRSFKTPTVRNAMLTAPYMHNGGFKTLEEVIDFYDAGGGIGIGLMIENQTLSSDSLKLTKPEKADLIQFIKSLTDTAGMNFIPSRLPDIVLPSNETRSNRKPLVR